MREGFLSQNHIGRTGDPPSLALPHTFVGLWVCYKLSAKENQQDQQIRTGIQAQGVVEVSNTHTQGFFLNVFSWEYMRVMTKYENMPQCYLIS